MKLLHEEPNSRGASWRSRFDSAPLSDSTGFAPYHRLFLDSSICPMVLPVSPLLRSNCYISIRTILFSWICVTSALRCANGSRHNQKCWRYGFRSHPRSIRWPRIRAPGSCPAGSIWPVSENHTYVSDASATSVPNLRHAAERAKRFASPTPTYRTGTMAPAY